MVSLKVTHKVIIGFGFIALLLLLSSMSALVSFNAIDQSNARVNQVAVPVQQQSNAAQVQLLKLAKLSALGFTAEQQSEISRYQQQFDDGSRLLAEKVDGLAQLTRSEQRFTGILADIDSSYQQYATAVAAMFDNKLNSLVLQRQIDEEYLILERLIDGIGADLMDISYLEIPGKEEQVELIAGTANRVDGQLLGLLNTLKEVAAYTEQSQALAGQENISFALSDMQVNVDYMANQVFGLDTDGLWQNITAQLTELTSRLEAQNSLANTKQAQVAAQQQSRQHLNTSEQQVEQVIAALDNLLLTADRQFSALQQGMSDAVSTGSTRTLGLTFILIVLAIIAAYMTIKTTLRPLTNINRALTDIAKGDFTRQVDVLKRDEFGELAEKVNSLTTALSSLIIDIQDNAAALNQNASQSASEVDEINSSLQHQQQQIAEINDVTRRLAESTRAIATQSAETTLAMQSALTQGQQIDSIAKQNSGKITHLAAQLTSTSQVMTGVNDEANNIGGILATIRGIAEQTNLLALNAAIEAARAGEQGRGFAVVADEVRSLAARTQQATDEIRVMIETLQSKSQEAVQAIASGKMDADGCVAQTQELAASLELVTNALAKTQLISSEVTAATETQLDLGSTIDSNMQQMVEAAKMNSEKTDRTLQHSDGVLRLASALKRAAGAFKIH